MDGCKCDSDNANKNEIGASRKELLCSCKCDRSVKTVALFYLSNIDFFSSKKESGSSSDNSHDCGYSSENNNGCCETGQY